MVFSDCVSFLICAVYYRILFFPLFLYACFDFQRYPTDRAYFIAKEILMTERTYKKDLEVISLVCCISLYSFRGVQICLCHLHLNVKIVQRHQIS